MASSFRTLAFAVAFLVIGAYGVVALRGPQGIPALLEKQQQIRHLQETNTDLQREIQRKKERIERLKHSPSEQQMEIRKQLKLLRPNETEFVLPEAPAKK
jgi:peptidoglycan hydrolase CwlO-like protein